MYENFRHAKVEHSSGVRRMPLKPHSECFDLSTVCLKFSKIC